MEINLPVHQPPRYQEFFDRIDRFFFHHELAFMYRQHFEDAVVADDTFGDTGKEAVAGEVIHSVHVELTRYQGMEIGFGVLVRKDPDRCLQLAVELRSNLRIMASESCS